MDNGGTDVTVILPEDDIDGHIEIVDKVSLQFGRGPARAQRRRQESRRHLRISQVIAEYGVRRARRR